jgi:hypothetical protein
MHATLNIILDNYLKSNCITDCIITDVLKDKYGDISLKSNQMALVYEMYYEYDGSCAISNKSKILVKADQIRCNKTSYMDVANQVKVFTLSISTIVKGSFTFAGTGKNPHIKYLLITNLDEKK